MRFVEEIRRWPAVRYGAQWALILALVFSAIYFGDSLDRAQQARANETATVQVVGSMLARTCRATPPKDLRQQGLVQECRLARQGKIAKAVPHRALPSKGTDPADVNPDTIPDTGHGVTPLGGSQVDGAVTRAVDAWFAEHDITVGARYEASLRKAVASSLARRPAARRAAVPPSSGEVASAVMAALLADPPKNGDDGATGRGVTSAALDGCDIVFTYTDDSTARVGPVCGPKGDTGASGTAGSPGPAGPRGPAGDPGYPLSFSTADGQTCSDPDGDHRYTCTLDAPDKVAPPSDATPEQSAPTPTEQP